LWQIAYSEICVVKKLWPDFKGEDFKKCIDEYGKRERRFGGS
jgi:undecaprenyl diphosphate synthase